MGIQRKKDDFFVREAQCWLNPKWIAQVQNDPDLTVPRKKLNFPAKMQLEVPSSNHNKNQLYQEKPISLPQWNSAYVNLVTLAAPNHNHKLSPHSSPPLSCLTRLKLIFLSMLNENFRTTFFKNFRVLQSIDQWT